MSNNNYVIIEHSSSYLKEIPHNMYAIVFSSLLSQRKANGRIHVRWITIKGSEILKIICINIGTVSICYVMFYLLNSSLYTKFQNTFMWQSLFMKKIHKKFYSFFSQNVNVMHTSWDPMMVSKLFLSILAIFLLAKIQISKVSFLPII